MKPHHIGYAVKDIEKSIKAFESLGFETLTNITEDIDRRVRIVFMRNMTTTIELIAPNGENNAVENVLRKNGPSPYHICYEVDDLDEAMMMLKKQGYIVMIKPQSASAIDENRVAFLLHKDIGIVELVEMNHSAANNTK